MSKKTIHGGARKGAGRKPVSDPKIGVTLYVEESIVNALGGIEAIRSECYEYLKIKANKIKE
jgi:hypothetical protein